MKRERMREAFSLVELVIVMGILAVMIGAVSLGLNYLRLTDAKSVANGVNSGLTELKSRSMGKKGYTCMHLYSYDGSYYISYTNDANKSVAEAAYDPATNGTGKKIGPDAVTLSYDGTTLGSGNEISFLIKRKDGAFDGTPPKEITAKASNGSEYTVHIVKMTGKHYME